MAGGRAEDGRRMAEEAAWRTTNPEQESTQAVHRVMESLLRDIRYGLRSLLNDKGFNFTVLLALPICIAANTAALAVVHSVLLKPLPVPGARSILIMSN